MLLARGENNPAQVASDTIAHFWLELKTEYGVTLAGSVLEELGCGVCSFDFEMLVLGCSIWDLVVFCSCEDIPVSSSSGKTPCPYI